ncbi:hypothetical protein [Aggregatilinea lenta]|uniref:hypothetical protein n=1 Tax=Aggregatilinea lenta TaxID=913108 RepID=UPI000E5B9956|nr:hypothetical protein [Aggregatilinea lenta]
MNRRAVVGIALVLVVVLAACGSAGVREAYTALGDGARPVDLTRTASFDANDDLNLVVTLNAHRDAVPVFATLIDPAGVSYTTDSIEASRTAGQIVLGLDFEAFGQPQWTPGDWTAVVFVDGEQAQTLRFTVRAPASQPVGEG